MPIDFATDDLPGETLHNELRRLREQEGPVAEVVFGGKPAWIVTGYEALTHAFKSEGEFPAGEWYRRAIEPTQGRTFESMDGPEHHLVRRLATPAFRSNAVARMERDGLAALAHELIDRFVRDGRGDLVPLFTARLPFLAISRVLGIPPDREREFVGWAVGILRFDQRCAQALTEYLLPVLAERRREPRDDVISGLLYAEADGRRFDDEEVLSHVRALFSAGATTTHDALATLVWLLHAQPDVGASVRSDRSVIPAILEELLRWETPVAVLPRLCVPGAQLAGVAIPAEAQMLFAIAAANRDPAVFPDPDRFDPQRDTRAKLTFGLGSHSCPGLHMARANLRVAISVLLERLPALRLVDEAAGRPRGASLRGSRALAAAWD